MANKLRPEPMPSATNALMDAIGQFYENDGLAGLLGMTSVNRQIHDATQAQMNAPNVRAGVAAAVDNPMTMAVGPATIRAYHGGPYSFDKFDWWNHLGQGEGAQSYGEGGYFAGNEGVAKNYRDTLSGGLFTNSAAEKYLARANGDKDAAMALLDRDVGSQTNEAIAGIRAAILKPVGHMYEVNLHVDPASLVDWDKPLAQQSPHVQDILSGKLGSAQPVGADLARAYRYPMHAGPIIGADAASGRELSQGLNQLGIPGIKYLDQGSRVTAGGEHIGTFPQDGGWVSKVRVQNRGGAGFSDPTDIFTTSAVHPTKEAADAWAAAKIGGGTSNYVMFDPARVEILRKYGLLPAAAVGAGAVSSGADAALTPVDHDPFGAPLVPVDHDPFGGQ